LRINGYHVKGCRDEVRRRESVRERMRFGPLRAAPA
jgi:hypothetical protein